MDRPDRGANAENSIHSTCSAPALLVSQLSLVGALLEGPSTTPVSRRVGDSRRGKGIVALDARSIAAESGQADSQPLGSLNISA